MEGIIKISPAKKSKFERAYPPLLIGSYRRLIQWYIQRKCKFVMIKHIKPLL